MGGEGRGSLLIFRSWDEGGLPFPHTRVNKDLEISRTTFISCWGSFATKNPPPAAPQPPLGDYIALTFAPPGQKTNFSPVSNKAHELLMSIIICDLLSFSGLLLRRGLLANFASDSCSLFFIIFILIFITINITRRL